MVVAPERGTPVFARKPQVPHEAASTMKAAVLAALYRSAVDWDARVPVANRFRSATGGVYGNSRAWDSDPEGLEKPSLQVGYLRVDDLERCGDDRVAGVPHCSRTPVAAGAAAPTGGVGRGGSTGPAA
jgi:hypothetical protein